MLTEKLYVIFDCDGVLVDTEHIALDVLAQCIGELGVQVEPASLLQRGRGGNLNILLTDLAKEHKVAVPKDFIPYFRKMMKKRFAEGLDPIEGMAELIRDLRVPFSVASNGPHDKMEQTLRMCGLWHFFEGKVYSAYDINAWKPKPDLYLHAASQMGEDPIRGVVIEDSRFGIIAAKSAGMEVFGLALAGQEEQLRAEEVDVLTSVSALRALFLSRGIVDEPQSR